MNTLLAVAVTPRTATILIDPNSNRFTLQESVSWECRAVDGPLCFTGKSDTVPVFLSTLMPDTAYRFSCETGMLEFQTPPCSLLVDSHHFGVSPLVDDNAKAFQLAIDAVPSGGTLFVAPGRYATGPIFLKSDMTLHLSEGAEIYAVSDRANWPILQPKDGQGRFVGSWEGQPEPSYAGLINGIACKCLRITGGGTIDGGGDRGDWWLWAKEKRQGARRARTIFLSNCVDVLLSGFNVKNSPSWTVHTVFCEELLAAAIRIENPRNSPNTDGFNPESCLHTTLIGLTISVGDDCIAIKSGKRGEGLNEHLAPTKHLKISNSRMEKGHGAVVVGSEMSGDITDVLISRCEFIGTDRGLRIKTRRGRGGFVERIRLEHTLMDGVGTALAVNSFYFCDADGRSDDVQSRLPGAVDETTPRVSSISVKDVVARKVQHAAAALLGLPEAPIKNVTINNFQISYDLSAKPEVPLMASDVAAVKNAGVLSEYAELRGEITIIQSEDC